jgi:YfiH family protein
MTNRVSVITLGLFDALPDVRHGFFTRQGGVSTGAYATLNASFGSGDDPGHVARNRALAMEMLGLAPGALATAFQVHGTNVAVVEEPWPQPAAPEADGLVTTSPGVALGVLTADCVPLLLADAGARVVAAAHAGWRGAAAGVVEAVIEAMCALGAKRGDIAATLGPCIAAASYEVGPEFPELVLGEPFSPERAESEEPRDHDLFRPSPREGHYLFDLGSYVARRAEAAGVARIAIRSADTYRDEDRFFSYRRATLRGERSYGRLLSAIALAP